MAKHSCQQQWTNDLKSALDWNRRVWLWSRCFKKTLYTDMCSANALIKQLHGKSKATKASGGLIHK